MVSNIINDLIVLWDPNTYLPTPVRVDLRVMVITRNFALTKAPELELHCQMV